MGFLKFIDKKLDDLNDAVERFGDKVDEYSDGIDELTEQYNAVERFGDKVDEYSDGIDELTEQYKDLSTDELLKIRDQDGYSLDILQKRAAAAQALKARGIGDDD